MPVVSYPRRLKRLLGEHGYAFLQHALGAIERLLPHTEVSHWVRANEGKTRVTWASSDRRQLNLRVHLSLSAGGQDSAVYLKATVSRKRVLGRVGEIERTIDDRERDLCGRVLERISTVLRGEAASSAWESLHAIQVAFDEQIVASHLKASHRLQLDLVEVLRKLRELAEQSYENKSLTFSCLLDPSNQSEADEHSRFPADFLERKKYRALTDGYRTAYRVSACGRMIQFEDCTKHNRPTSGKHFFPEWAEHIAAASQRGVCGMCLTRHGDILVFDAGTLRFTYRFGRWQYWNHSHIIDLLRNRARVQKVALEIVGTVANAVYRAALDVSFRRTGGLFVLLRAKRNLHRLVLKGDAISDARRPSIDHNFDGALPSHQIQVLSPRLLVELAGLDGAIVLNNRGAILAYAAVLQPRKKGRTGLAEGSRTKAAIGASKYGLAVKVSSDGDITFFEKGKSFLKT
jgi:hypothetical protein